MANYGTFLKEAREAKLLTLRDVEKKTGISNAYLSQLESNKIKHPSPINLYKLGQLYDVPYEVLMEKVGYPVPKLGKQTTRSGSRLASRMGKITPKEEDALIEYLDFLRSRRGAE